MVFDKPCRTCTDFQTWAKIQKQTFDSEKKSEGQAGKEHHGASPIEGTTATNNRNNCPLDKDELGSKTWAFLHTMAAYYPDKPTSEQRTNMKKFFNIFAKFYPCNICAEDLQVQLEKSPPRTDSQHQLSEWLCGIHNEVNQKLGKPLFDCTLVNQRWRDGWLDVVVQAMDNWGAISGPDLKTARKNFFQWAVKWFYTNYGDDGFVKPDAPELACLLQAMGFQLRECNHKENDNSESKSKNDSVKVIIECGTSKMRVVMEMEEVSCQCPNQDDAKDASFWSVSGTGPMGSMENMNKVVETGSNLLPSISKDVSTVVRDVTQRLIKLIKNIPDVNQNTDSNLNLSMIDKTMKLSTRTANDALVRRHSQSDFSVTKYRSLDTLIHNEGKEHEKKLSPLPGANLLAARARSSQSELREAEMLRTKADSKNNPSSNVVDLSPIQANPKPPPLLRQGTFDMDISSNADTEPRSSLPKISSSPVVVPQLCTTLSQISLQSDEKASTLVEILMEASRNLKHALKMLMSNSQDSEDVFLKPAQPRSSSFTISPGDISRPGSSCSLPNQSKLQSTGLQKPSVRRNVATSFRKPNDGRPPTPGKLSTTGKSLLQRRNMASPKSYSRSALPQIKVDTPRPINTCASTSNSLSARTIISAKRRVSPDAKSSPSADSNHKFAASLNTSHLKVTSNRESSHTSNEASKLNASGGVTSKFGFIKKKM